MLYSLFYVEIILVLAVNHVVGFGKENSISSRWQYFLTILASPDKPVANYKLICGKQTAVVNYKPIV